MEIELGAKYKDKITGFVGRATGYVQYISGCNQALLAPAVTAEGSQRDGCWFDIQRLERLNDEVIVLDNSKTPGCDKSAPIR